MRVKVSNGFSDAICHQTGKYACTVHDNAVVYIVRGEKFPMCSYGRHEAEWLRVDNDEGGRATPLNNDEEILGAR